MPTNITWLGHAGVRIVTPSGKTILIDPWLTGNPKAPFGVDGLDACDYMLLTHAHGDHAADAPAISRRFEPKTVAIYDFVRILEKQGLTNLVGISLGGTVNLDGIRVTGTVAFHGSTTEGPNGEVLYAGNPMGFVVAVPDGPTFYHSGDTSLFGDMKLIGELHKPDIAFLPIGDFYTMGPEAGAMAAKLLGVKKAIPIHFGTFPVLTGRPEEFRQYLAGSGIEVLQLEPGVTVSV
jgi:L-ascorbate metabolism protein UlaG (beta-lactamase superfamily)